MTTSVRLLSALAAGLLLAACSAAMRGPGSVRCVPEAVDSAWALAGPVYRNCEVGRVARRENPDMRLDYQPSQTCETALLEFVVDATGAVEPRTVRVVRGNSPQFAEALIATMPRWRYRPAQKAGTPVRQVVQEGQSVIMRREISSQPRQPSVNIQNSCMP